MAPLTRSTVLDLAQPLSPPPSCRILVDRRRNAGRAVTACMHIADLADTQAWVKRAGVDGQGLS